MSVVSIVACCCMAVVLHSDCCPFVLGTAARIAVQWLWVLLCLSGDLSKGFADYSA